MYVEFLGIPRERTGVSDVELDVATLGEALHELAGRFPRLQELMAGDRFHPAVAVSLNTDLFISDPATRLGPRDRLLILSADAGG